MNPNLTPLTSNQTPIDGLTYEQAFQELEAIVSSLEKEEHTLEEALALFERGQSLSRYCAGLLEKAELKVRQLSSDGLTDIEGDFEH